MPTPNESTVRRLLSINNRGLILRAAIDGGWTAVAEKYPDRLWWRRKATHAGLVWEYAVDDAIKALEPDTGAHAVAHVDTVSFIFDDAVFVRMKKADLRLMTSNYPTSLASMFHDHDEDLFGYDGLQRVEAAYVLNRFGTGIDWIGIVARENKYQLWSFELEKAGAVVERLPLPEKAEPAVARVVRPKKSEGDDQEAKGK